MVASRTTHPRPGNFGAFLEREVAEVVVQALPREHLLQGEMDLMGLEPDAGKRVLRCRADRGRQP